MIFGALGSTSPGKKIHRFYVFSRNSFDFSLKFRLEARKAGEDFMGHLLEVILLGITTLSARKKVSFNEN